MAISAIVTFYLESVRQAWEFILESGAGIGLVLILRWYWWRVTAVSEITALVAAAGGFLAIRFFTSVEFPDSLLYLVPWTTAWWLLVTWLTPPEPMDHPAAFYRRIRPGGPGWRRVTAAIGEPEPAPVFDLAMNWVAGCTLVYSILFGIGSALFWSGRAALGWLVLTGIAGAWLCWDLTRREWKVVTR